MSPSRGQALRIKVRTRACLPVGRYVHRNVHEAYPKINQNFQGQLLFGSAQRDSRKVRLAGKTEADGGGQGPRKSGDSGLEEAVMRVGRRYDDQPDYYFLNL